MALQDPLFRKLANGTISWADAAEEYPVCCECGKFQGDGKVDDKPKGDKQSEKPKGDKQSEKPNGDKLQGDKLQGDTFDEKVDDKPNDGKVDDKLQGDKPNGDTKDETDGKRPEVRVEGPHVVIDMPEPFEVVHGKKRAPMEMITTTILFNPQQIRTIVARNLPRDVTVDELKPLFERFGPVRDLYIPKNTNPDSPYFGSIKGFALVKYLSSSDSTRAFMELQSRLMLRGKQISLEFAKEDR